MQLQYLLNLQDSKVNVKLHYHADPRPMLVFLSLFSHWLSNDHTMGQLKWWQKEKKRYRTTCQMAIKHTSNIHILENQAIRSRNNLTD